ncbi:MAG: BTAD domain-containing putative transcriptional regulator [Anaerolineae bacterium]
MSDFLTFRLLGKPQILLDNQPVTGFISAKSQALLLYLAVTGRPHTRETLAGLLWGDMPESQAAKNLRNALSNLRALAGAHLSIARDEVSFIRDDACWIDARVFMDTLSGNLAESELDRLHSAVELYQGEFLQGFYVTDALPIEEWILGHRSLLNGLMVQALHNLVVRHLAREECAAGIDYANRLLEIEPWREETHRHLMLLLAHSRQRTAALAQYDKCCQALERELGVEPMAETTSLYERIKAAGAALPHNLPPQPTPMVGREAELAQIAGYLNSDHAQLLTLVGPGGIGKTRLALQAAARCVEAEVNVERRFSDGVFVVPLTSASLADGLQISILAALAEVLKVDLQGPVHPQAQLLSYLRDKDMLLILDNFDQLVPEARQLVDILRLAPHIKLLVTSRVRLHLQGEWLIEVGGLPFPEITQLTAQEAVNYSAITLFVLQARRMQSGFILSDEDTPDVIRICQLVEGAPLGIELAASWLRALACREIATEIERGLDFLQTTLQDVPERHRSIRAVFDYSWNLISPAEQAAFCELSVFKGGFSREAASQVVGVSLPLLVGLLDKSLLHRSAVGRFEIHDLLRQYAQEMLLADPERYQRVNDVHCRYYAELLTAHRVELKGDDVAVALTTLDVERENVRAAWNWAVSHRRIDEMNLFMECL